MSLSNTTSFASREVCNLKFVKPGTLDEVFSLSYANTETLGLNDAVVFAYGGKTRPKRVAFHGEKDGTFVVETQMQTIELYKFITGAEVIQGYEWLEREVITCEADGYLTLSKKPKANTVSAYAEGDEDGQKLIILPGEGRTISAFPTESGKRYVVYYVSTNDDAVKLSITTSSRTDIYTMYADTIALTDDGEALNYKFIAYKLSPRLDLQLAFSNIGDPVTLKITFDLMATSDGKYLDIIFEGQEDTGDAIESGDQAYIDNSGTLVYEDSELTEDGVLVYDALPYLTDEGVLVF